MAQADGEDEAALDVDTFVKVDMRVGTVIAAEVNEKARKPAYRVDIDFGEPLGVRTSSAQITVLYEPEQLIGKQVVAVVNFPPRQIASVRSQVLILGVCDGDGEVVLLAPERPVPNGGRIH